MWQKPLSGVLKNKLVQFGIGIEIDENSISILKKNLKLNKLEKKVKILEKLNLNKINDYISNKDLKNTLFLIDIESGEYDLINSTIIKLINKNNSDKNSWSNKAFEINSIIFDISKRVNNNFFVRTIVNFDDKNPFTSDDSSNVNASFSFEYTF